MINQIFFILAFLVYRFQITGRIQRQKYILNFTYSSVDTFLSK